MVFHLDKIDPNFRNIVDLLFFSNRMDLELSEFAALLSRNYSDHTEYIWDRFKKSSEIYWDNADDLWHHRIDLILSINDKNLTKKVSESIEQKMFILARSKYELNVKYDTAYMQFVQYCKVKHSRKESLLSIKNYLTELPAHIKTEKVVGFINNFIPSVFETFDEYAAFISKKIVHSPRNFVLLLELEKIGIPINKETIIQLAQQILLDEAFGDKNKRAFLTVIRDPFILSSLKKEYNDSYRSRLLEFVYDCDYSLLEENYLSNIKNIISLDESIADELAIDYCNKIYTRRTGHKRANIDRVIRLLKKCPQISSKKLLAQLSVNNKIADIKHLLLAFPDLKKLAAFV
jgi:hypothetical protein